MRVRVKNLVLALVIGAVSSVAVAALGYQRYRVLMKPNGPPISEGLTYGFVVDPVTQRRWGWSIIDRPLESSMDAFRDAVYPGLEEAWPRERSGFTPESLRALADLNMVESIEVGWPLRCGRMLCIQGVDGSGLFQNIVIEGADLRTPEDPITTLPTHPMWAGLGADLAIYSVAGWLAMMLGTAVARLRRGRRRKRGLCPFCGYDRRALDPAAPCPECVKPS
jgi:hypothetical protein